MELQYCTNIGGDGWREETRMRRNKEKLHTYFSYLFGVIVLVKVVFRKTIVIVGD